MRNYWIYKIIFVVIIAAFTSSYLTIPFKGSSRIKNDLGTLIEEILLWLNQDIDKLSNPSNSVIQKVSINNASKSDINSLIEEIEKEIKGYDFRAKEIQVAYNSALALLNYELLKFQPENQDRAICSKIQQHWEQALSNEVKLIDKKILEKSHNLYTELKIANWLYENSINKTCNKGIKNKYDCNSEQVKDSYTTPSTNLLLKNIFKTYRDFENNQDLDSNKILSLKIKINNWRRETDYDARIPLAHNLIRAMSGEMRFKLRHEINCNISHLYWYEAKKSWNICEKERINKWAIHGYQTEINFEWVEERYNRSKECATKIYTCCKDTLALNPDTISIQTQNTSRKGSIQIIVPPGDNCCIYSGCTDSLAVNYNPLATESDTCIYLRCIDTCYRYGYNYLKSPRYLIEQQKGIIEPSDSLCQISEKVCGCTNECAENYDSSAIIDDGSCQGDVCGCLDSLAVNYALDTLSRYYIPNTSKHIQDSCHYRGLIDRCINPEEYDDPSYRHQFARQSDGREEICGCLDTIALNYSPSFTHHDSSRCQYYTLNEIVKLKTALVIQIDGLAEDLPKLRDNLSEAVEQLSSRTAERVREAVTFADADNGNSLVTIFDFDLSKNKGSLFDFNQDGIPLGLYNYRPVNDVIDFIFDFLSNKSPDTTKPDELFSRSPLEGFIFGEADGNPIKRSGIAYRNNGKTLNTKFSKTEVSIKSEKDIDIRSLPMNENIYLEDGDRIFINTSLALLRAFFVKQRIESTRDIPSNLRLIAKANKSKGSKYRKVYAYLKFPDYFLKSKKIKKEAMNKLRIIERHEEILKNGGSLPTQITECKCSK